MINTMSPIHADIVTTAVPLSLTSDLSDIPYIEDAETNNGYRSTTNITPQPSPTKSTSATTTTTLGSITKKGGFPLTKLKSQFKPAQLPLSTGSVDQGTKDIDKLAMLGTMKQTGLNSNEPSPHSVPVMTGMRMRNEINIPLK